MDSSRRADAFRRIPSVDQMLQQPAVSEWVSRTSHGFVVSEIQACLGEVRQLLLSHGPGDAPVPDLAVLVTRLVRRVEARLRSSHRAVINATGVVIHTNLGRAPLSGPAQESLSAIAAGYSNLEYELETGARSHRDLNIEPALTELLGCEAATVVNNNAAALLLSLNTIAEGREVIVSRGELVEIGGSFRIPEILAKSGAVLREVGTTNKTRVSDYEAAIRPDTALLLRVHPSNFRIRGFTHRPALSDLLELARANQLPLLEDIGSGCLVDLRAYGIAEEPMARESLAAGVDLVCFSADKLLGGPQAGILAGARRWVDMVRKNPLMRTYRVGRLIHAALEATLLSYRSGRALAEVPVLRLISTPWEKLQRRTDLLVRRLRPGLPEGVRVQRVRGESVVGGGSCPETALPSPLLALSTERLSVARIESRLRANEPPVIVRLEEDRILVDLRTVFPAQEKTLLAALRASLAPSDRA
jgi:L-seryl-tRNA(Ser) seleniumtransferase